MSETKLAPCPNPWCGSIVGPFVASFSLVLQPVYRGQCSVCGIHCNELKQTQAEATAAWNTRAPDPRIAAAEGMAKAIQELLRYPNTEIYPQGNRAALATARAALAAWNALK